MTAIHRFLDADEDSNQEFVPFTNYENKPLVPLKEAAQSLRQLVPDIDRRTFEAKQKSSNLVNGLSVDEAAAIYLYTMEWTEPHESVYNRLNRTLRSEAHDNLKPWFSYLKLFLSALNKLPSIKGTVWRGCRGDVSDRYQQDCTWWGFSSCADNVSVLEQFIGRSGARTLFKIQCINGKSIRNQSSDKTMNEILLMPGTYLRVVDKQSREKGLHVIYLQETSAPDPVNASSRELPPSITETFPKDKVFNSSQSQSGGELKLAETYTTYKPSHIHPACQFQTDKHWLYCQYHQHDQQSIKKPDELEMGDPPCALDPEILDRIQGSMIGMALGDALGAHVEFRPRQYLVEHPVTDLEGGGTWGLKKGQFTDDTSMALCLANSLVARRDFIPYDQLVRYKWWYRYGYMSSTGKCFDIGAATSQSLREFEHRQRLFADKYQIPLEKLDLLSDPGLLEKFDVYCSDDGVAGNGALMRLAPVPLFFHKHPTYAVELSGQSGRITHGDQKAYDACRYYGALIVAALRNEAKNQLLDNDFYSKHAVWFNNKPLTPDVMKIATGSYKRKGGYADGIRGKGYIVDALEAAMWAFWSDDNSFEKGALAAVNLGDDTDTTAAIYGQLAGTYYGYKSLPPRWLKHVYANNFMATLSKWILYEGQMWQPKKTPIPIPSVLPFQSQPDAAIMPSSAQKSNLNTNPTQPNPSTPSWKQSSPNKVPVGRKSSRPDERVSKTTVSAAKSRGTSSQAAPAAHSSHTSASRHPKSSAVGSTALRFTSGSNNQLQPTSSKLAANSGTKRPSKK